MSAVFMLPSVSPVGGRCTARYRPSAQPLAYHRRVLPPRPPPTRNRAVRGRQCCLEAIVVPGLLWQVREHRREVPPRVPQPACLGVEPQQGVRDRERDHLGISELRQPAHPSISLQFVVDLHVQRGQQDIQFVVHATILDTPFAFLNAPSGDTATRALRASGPPCGQTKDETADHEPGVPQQQRPQPLFRAYVYFRARSVSQQQHLDGDATY